MFWGDSQWKVWQTFMIRCENKGTQGELAKLKHFSVSTPNKKDFAALTLSILSTTPENNLKDIQSDYNIVLPTLPTAWCSAIQFLRRNISQECFNCMLPPICTIAGELQFFTSQEHEKLSRPASCCAVERKVGGVSFALWMRDEIKNCKYLV